MQLRVLEGRDDYVERLKKVVEGLQSPSYKDEPIDGEQLEKDIREALFHWAKKSRVSEFYGDF